MKKFFKNKVIIVSCLVIVVFGLYNAVWYLGTVVKYDQYVKGMDEFAPKLSYVLTGEDGYLYNVKYPDYLYFTGNLAVAKPDDTIALLIWPSKLLGEVKYGVQIQVNEQGDLENIMVDTNMRPLDAYYNDLLDEHKDDIKILMDKANKKWPNVK